MAGSNKRCTVCNGKLDKAFTLGKLYVSNFIPADHRSSDYPKSDLTMLVCPLCGTARLRDTVEPDSMYKNYYYQSGINWTMKHALSNIVNSCINSIKYNDGDIWLDIACNDGTLLSFVETYKNSMSKGFIKIGIDPSNIATKAKGNGIIVNDYFSKEAYARVASKKAKIITCIAVFYDLEDPHPFLCDVYDVLDDEGLFVIQMSYSPLMLNQLEIGNIAQEHVHYYTYIGLENLLNQHGLFIQDVELNDVNGGSFRVYCCKDAKVFKNQQQRDVAGIRKRSLLEYEYQINMFDAYKVFIEDIDKLKVKLNNFIDQQLLEGKTVYGLAASTKANTLLQYFGLNKEKITAIADRNPAKHGLKTIGTEIPIISEEEMRAAKPDYLLLLAWHFIDEIVCREGVLLNSGTKLIVPMPKFEVI
jgi:hypothetical protein